MVAPWVLRNWFWVGNPVAPFFNSWFPNPAYHPGMERIYAETLSHYTGIKHYWQIPLQLTLRSGFDGGIFGPVFLLAPLGLLALRFKSGRRLLLAGLVFALPAYLNTGTRFLIPSAPFWALAMGIGLADVPAALPVLALFHALVCWPPILSKYCDPSNWRISSFPGRAALRLDPPEPFIAKTIGDYALKMPIERNVPRGERIFSFAGRPEAYIDRDIIVSYESTLGNLANDILWAPQAHKPSECIAFQVSAGQHSRSPRSKHRIRYRILDRVRDAPELSGQGTRSFPRLAHQRVAQWLGSAARLRQQLCHPLVHLGSHRSSSTPSGGIAGRRTHWTRWSSNATQPGTPAYRWKSAWIPVAG